MMNNFVKVSLPLKQNDKQMTTSNANQSGTGVFYQAMPAVGADGKNVMKLIPVQRVNGQFVRMQTSNNLPSAYNKADVEPQRLFARPIHLSHNPISHSNAPILQPAISGRYILKRPSDVNVMLNPVGTEKYNESVTVSTGNPIQVQRTPIPVQRTPSHVQSSQIHVRRAPIQVQNAPIHVQRTPIQVHRTPIQVQRSPIQVQRTPIQIQVPVPVVATKVAQNVPMASPVLNCGKTLTLLNKKQFPVTVKSPVLPNGHYLQIPPNAQVKTLPASALPHAIKKRILTPPISSTTCASSSMSNLPTVVYVSPVNTMKLGIPPQASEMSPPPLPLNPFPRRCSQSLEVRPATNSTQPLKSVPKETRNPVTPIKWVVQERSDSARPCLVPQNSSSMTSEILKALAQMESGQNVGQSTAATLSPLPDKLTPIGPGKDNALVMCNGKVYFVAKKTPEFSDHSPQIQKVGGTISSPPKHSIDDGNINQRIKVSSLNPLTSSFPGTSVMTSPRQGSGHIVINDGPDDIIDLCDDDPQDEFVSQSAASHPAADEDEDSNVIFVSYIPPKSSTESAGSEMQIDQEKEVDQVQENATEDKAVLEKESFQEKTLSQEIPEEVNQSVNVQEAQIQQNMEVCQEEQNETEKDSVPSIPAESVKSSVDPCSDRHIEVSELNARREQDHQLKLRFGITSDVKICLQRINSTESRAVPRKGPRIGSINKRTLDGIRKLMQGSRIGIKTKRYVQTLVLSMKEKDECSPRDPKRKKVGLPKISDAAPDSGITCTPHCTATETAVERAKTPSKAISSAGSETITAGSEAISSPGSETISSAGSETITAGSGAISSAGSETITTGSEAITSAGSDTIGCTGSELTGSTGSETSTRPLEESEPEEIVKQDSASSSSSVEEERMVPNVQEAESGMGDHGGISRNIPKSKTVQPRSPKGKGKQCRLPETTMEEETPDQEQMEISAVPTEESNPSTTKGTKMNAPAAVVVQEKEPTEEPASVEVCCPSTLSESNCSTEGEPLEGDLFTAAPMDPEEIKRHEKIKRLKELLKEKEAALEMIRKNMIQ